MENPDWRVFVGFSMNSTYSVLSVFIQFKGEIFNRHTLVFLSTFALNFNFPHCLGLIDVFSANEHAEIFACISLDNDADDVYPDR